MWDWRDIQKRPNPVEYWLQKTSTKGDPIAMSIIPHQKRYLPHEIGTRIHAVTLYRSAKDIEFVCRRYKISKASLMRWNKRYDGTPESLADRSHRPHTVHPRAHTNVIPCISTEKSPKNPRRYYGFCLWKRLIFDSFYQSHIIDKPTFLICH